MAEEDETLTRAVAARLSGAGGEFAWPMRRLLAWLGARALERGTEQVSVAEAVAGSSVKREQVIEAFRALEAAGAGRFLRGRRSLVSRFHPHGANLVHAARLALADRATLTLVEEAFRAPPGLTVALSLPGNLGVTGAGRAGDFLETPPMNGDARWPGTTRGRRPTRAPKDEQVVVLGLNRLRSSTPVMVALAHGLFRREGLCVELHTFETAEPLMDALLAGRLTGGGFIPFPISMAAELTGGVSLRHLAVQVEDDAHPVSRLLVRPGSGLRSLADLRGRRVAVLPTFAYHAWLEVLLRGAEVDPQSLEICELSPTCGAVALSAGAVDALFTSDPAATLALTDGAVPLEVEPSVPRAVLYPLPVGSFVVNAAFAEARPTAAAALARALDAAIELAAAAPEHEQAAVAAHLPEPQACLVGAFPPARYARSTELNAETLARLGERYHELGVLRRPFAPTPLRIG